MSGQKKSWWGRNWLWVLPAGCLGMLVVAVGLLAGIVVLGLKIIRSSDPYVQAVAAAKADPRVIAALGSPVTEGWFFNGSVNEKTDWSSGSGGSTSGNADLKISIHGPKGEGTIHAVATIQGGKWVFSLLVVTVKDSGRTIDLNEKPKKTEVNPVYQFGLAKYLASFTRQTAGFHHQYG